MSDEYIQKKYFTFQELTRLNGLEGKHISEVNYYVWVNRIDQAAPYVFIDKLEIIFSDANKIILTAGEESNALYVLHDFDAAEEILMLEHRFSGQITLKKFGASKDKFWKDVLNLRIQTVQLSKDGDQYLSDAVVLDFGEEKRLIGLSPEEGIIIDYFEED
jgi:hypothetical protein